MMGFSKTNTYPLLTEIADLEAKIKKLEADRDSFQRVGIKFQEENKRLKEAIEELENEIKGSIGQHDSGD